MLVCVCVCHRKKDIIVFTSLLISHKSQNLATLKMGHIVNIAACVGLVEVVTYY